jgi:hypothetical protein
MSGTFKLKEEVHRPGRTRADQVLLCLAVDDNRPKKPAELRSLAIAAGIPAAKKWNVSSVLASLKSLAIRSPEGWELSGAGQGEVARLLGTKTNAVTSALTSLRAAASKLKSADVRDFVDEAIACAEAAHHRAAVVLSWVGALAVLYEVVVAGHLAAFNTEAQRRDVKWRPAKTADDLARMKEHDFLQILETLSIVGKSVKAELEGCLKLRNGCGHPNTLKVSDNKVAAHIETLVLNVFAHFT